ncbi:deoxyribonuclease-1-like [Centroberyx affinis]|uniref:deoxyribonuclease-1-like n=1 Tax=Centroberyx affinis TaxID=166261 RepID=UPI003A5C168D
MRIAAFNIKKLGWRKVSNEAVLSYLIKIVSRYSVVLILEVVDKKGAAMERFLQKLNSTRANKKRPFSMILSSRLGRDSYKEQFVFLYREDDVKLIDSYQYEDNQVGDEDAFAREPYILRFSCPTAVVKDLVLVPVHTKPVDSEKELDELHDVVDVVRRKWKTDNIMILGDFNADGRYISKRSMGEIRIRSNLSYHWLIDDDVDTTAHNCNDHTYDRIVLYGEAMLKAIVPRSAKPFNFQKAFSLTDAAALSISDHYPVEVRLRCEGRKKLGVPQAPKKKTLPGPTKKKAVSGAEKKCAQVPAKKKSPGPQQRRNALAGPFEMRVTGPTKKKGPQTEQKKQKKKGVPGGLQRNRQKGTPPRKRMQSSCASQTPAKRRRLEK